MSQRNVIKAFRTMDEKADESRMDYIKTFSDFATEQINSDRLNSITSAVFLSPLSLDDVMKIEVEKILIGNSFVKVASDSKFTFENKIAKLKPIAVMSDDFI